MQQVAQGEERARTSVPRKPAVVERKLWKTSTVREAAVKYTSSSEHESIATEETEKLSTNGAPQSPRGTVSEMVDSELGVTLCAMPSAKNRKRRKEDSNATHSIVPD